MQMLFQADIGHQTPDEVRATFWKAGDPVEPEVRAYAEDLFLIAQEQQPKIDGLIAEHSAHWRLERMPVVDRNVLRIAVYEMLRTDTPPAVIIDEALELARKFSGEESVHFVNGVLDAVRRELPAAASATPS